ncbi:MAG: NADH-quinone oxidoreductase subunit N [Lacipirellulaceae bacterium]
MLSKLVPSLSADTTAVSLPLFVPECALAATIVVILLARVLPGLRRVESFWFALAGLLVACAGVAAEARGGLVAIPRIELFTGMLVHDATGVYARGLLVGFGVLYAVLSRVTGLATRDDGQDYFTLVLGALLGMCLMCRANHLMTVVLGVEMASVPSYVLAGFIKGRRLSGEAALKYSLYGAAAAGVMLYGMSLAAGLLGTAHLPTIGQRLAALEVVGLAGDAAGRGVLMVLALASVMVCAGLAFKLSAVPFHSWAPDVFAGAPAEVGAFLSVASKGAALVLALRLAAAIAGSTAEDAAAARIGTATTQLVAASVAEAPLEPIRTFLGSLVALTAAATCTLGNFAALKQANMKRMLAYSTIAHAGYLLMPVAVAILVAGADPAAANRAAAAVLFYAGGYVFLNFTAFAAVALLRNSLRSEQIADYAGLVYAAPVVAVALAASLLGLLGLPPLVGFWGKLAALRSLAEAGSLVTNVLLAVAVVNTAVSLVYYLRVVRTMFLDAPDEKRLPAAIPAAGLALLAVAALPILLLGLLPESLASAADAAARGLFD